MNDFGAFVPGPRARLEPTASGPLDGLTFVVKDLIDVAGHVTGAGNPAWAAGQAPAARSAPVVEHLLRAGATLIGKTITDELGFSLEGENHHYGTPLNPRAPDRLPGGSSSGSAVAVAAGLADLALGTDTGGSVRVPASFPVTAACRSTAWCRLHRATTLSVCSRALPNVCTPRDTACSAHRPCKREHRGCCSLPTPLLWLSPTPRLLYEAQPCDSA
jgi:amidase